MNTFKRLKEFYWPFRSHLIISLIFLLLMTAITVVYPIILQVTIDDVILLGKYEWIPYLALGFIALMLVKGVSSYITQYKGDVFGIKAVYQLRNALYEKLQFLSFRYYDSAKTGDLMSRLTADVEGFRFFLSFGIAELIRITALIGISLCVMLYYSVSLTIVTMITLPFLLIVVFKFESKVSPAFRGIRKSFGKLNTNVQENISGIQTVKSLSREEFEIGKFNSANDDYRQKYVLTSRIWAKYFPLMEFCGHLSVVFLFAYGGYLVMNDSLSPGELVAFYSLVWYIVWPIANLGYIVNLFSQSKASGERLLEILDESKEVKESENAIELKEMKGDVEFRNVSLQYYEAEQEALSNISFKLPAGKTLGLIGATGSGKTSITQLITRFYEPTEGEVLIDGKNIKEYTSSSLRHHIGFVLQETFLFSSTIKDNISYGRPDATIDDIIEAAKRAQAHEFISKLPEGYDTMLGERGLGLSGGQKQRIAIARAICLNPAILVLDDATSAVDMQTEQSIQLALQEVMKDRTTIIIAHRISSLKHCDEIIVLQQGAIVERGTHHSLISNNGLYESIYNIQFSDRSRVSKAF